MTPNTLNCQYADLCSACPWIDIDPQVQAHEKIKMFQDQMEKAQISLPKFSQTNITFQKTAFDHFRDRLDFVIENGNIGLFSKKENRILDIETCPLLTEPLQNLYHEFRKIKWPIQKGSFRLRVSFSGKKGAWLGFSNLDIKKLIEEKNCLSQLLDLVDVVEIGQKRKVLLRTLKLNDPHFEYWTRTWVSGQPLSLLSSVGSFSQAGDLPNQILTKIIEQFIPDRVHRMLEFGSGTGNLTFPALGPLDVHQSNAQNPRQVVAVEYDPLACQALEQSAHRHGYNSETQKRLTVICGDFQRHHAFSSMNENFSFSDFDLVLVNPPRSGLMSFLDPLKETSKRPQYFIYMSCYLDSFTRDSVVLKDCGYSLDRVTLVDQFPHSPHFEIISLWKQ